MRTIASNDFHSLSSRHGDGLFRNGAAVAALDLEMEPTK